MHVLVGGVSAILGSTTPCHQTHMALEMPYDHNFWRTSRQWELKAGTSQWLLSTTADDQRSHTGWQNGSLLQVQKGRGV